MIGLRRDPKPSLVEVSVGIDGSVRARRPWRVNCQLPQVEELMPGVIQLHDADLDATCNAMAAWVTRRVPLVRPNGSVVVGVVTTTASARRRPNDRRARRRHSEAALIVPAKRHT